MLLSCHNITKVPLVLINKPLYVLNLCLFRDMKRFLENMYTISQSTPWEIKAEPKRLYCWRPLL